MLAVAFAGSLIYVAAGAAPRDGKQMAPPAVSSTCDPGSGSTTTSSSKATTSTTDPGDPTTTTSAPGQATTTTTTTGKGDGTTSTTLAPDTTTTTADQPTVTTGSGRATTTTTEAGQQASSTTATTTGPDHGSAATTDPTGGTSTTDSGATTSTTAASGTTTTTAPCDDGPTTTTTRKRRRPTTTTTAEPATTSTTTQGGQVPDGPSTTTTTTPPPLVPLEIPVQPGAGGHPSAPADDPGSDPGPAQPSAGVPTLDGVPLDEFPPPPYAPVQPMAMVDDGLPVPPELDDLLPLPQSRRQDRPQASRQQKKDGAVPRSEASMPEPPPWNHGPVASSTVPGSPATAATGSDPADTQEVAAQVVPPAVKTAARKLAPHTARDSLAAMALTLVVGTGWNIFSARRRRIGWF